MTNLRRDREAVLIDTAFLWATRSTCSRLAVGCVIHRQGRILVQGYNGAPAGMPHCDHLCTCHQYPSELWPRMEDGVEIHRHKCPVMPEACRAVHAEQNAIAWAARTGVKLEGSYLVCTHQPCLSCARSIINAGIVDVLFVEEYRLKDGLELLNLAPGIKVWRWVDQSLSRVIG